MLTHKAPPSMQGAPKGPVWSSLAALSVFALTTRGRCCQGLEQGAREQPRLLAVLPSLLLPKAFPEAAVPAQSLVAELGSPFPLLLFPSTAAPGAGEGSPLPAGRLLLQTAWSTQAASKPE